MDLDMDAPAAKIVKFLRAYQNAGTRFRPRKPSTSEAAALEALLIQQMGHLSAPDIKKQLDSRSRRSNEVFYNHVILEYTSGRSALDDDAALSGPSPGVSMYGRRFPCDIESSIDDDCAANWPICPRDVMRQAGSDFFLDAVTAKSPLQKSSAPLAAMVKGAVDALQLLPSSPQELMQLIQFTRMVEEGYPRAGYHCLLHAADVTNHLASLLRMAGIGTALHSSAHRRTMLAAVFGAGAMRSHPISKTETCIEKMGTVETRSRCVRKLNLPGLFTYLQTILDTMPQSYMVTVSAQLCDHFKLHFQLSFRVWVADVIVVQSFTH
jgi:hypothetical protein